MRKIKKSIVIFSLFLLRIQVICPDTQFLDILYLKDGRSLEGLIIDRLPGSSVKLETLEKTVLTFEMDEIEKIESKKSDDRIRVRNVDAVFLNGGVVFTGTIIEQVPNSSITLETESGLILPFPSDGIWKIITTKRIEGEGDTGKTIENEVESFKIALQIEIGRKTLAKIKESKSTEKNQIDTSLQEEVVQLQEELEALQDKQLQMELENSAIRNARISEEIEELQQEIEELLDELLKQAQECEKLDESEDKEDVSFWKGGDTKRKTRSPLYFMRPCQSDKDPAGKTGEKDTVDEDLKVLEDQFSVFLDEVSMHATPLFLDDEINTFEESAEKLSTRLQLEEILGSGRVTLGTWLFSSRMVDSLALEDRLFLYESYKRRDQFKGVILNSVPFLYIGSWSQGDWFGALSGYLLFVLLVQTGVLLDDINVLGGETDVLGHDEDGYYYYRDFSTKGLLNVIGLLSIGYAHSLIRPIVFVNRRNKPLREFLELEKSQIRKGVSEVSVNPPAIGFTMTSDNELKVQVKLLSLQY